MRKVKDVAQPHERARLRIEDPDGSTVGRRRSPTSRPADRQPASRSSAISENAVVKALSRVGDYSLEQELGRGAVGVVYRARSADGRVVAIKTFDPALARDDTFRARLAHEARVAREVRDPHLVRILEAGEARRQPVPRARVRSRRLARGQARATVRCRSTRRSASWRRSRPASTPSTGAASSIGTSSRRTSCSARTARLR